MNPLVGRSEDLKKLEAAWRRVLDENAAETVVVSGPAGIGKTALKDEFLRSHDVPVLTGSFPIAAGGVRVPGAGLASLRASGTSNAILNKAVRDVREEVFSNSQGADLGWTFVRGLLSVSEDTPMIVVFEDIHWADDPSASAFLTAINAVQTAPILFVLTMRTGPSEPLSSFAHELLRDDEATEVALGRLSLDAIAELYETIVGERSELSEIERVRVATDGVPLLLSRYLEAVNDGRLGDPDAFGSDLVSAVRSLPWQARRVLEAAAVLGSHPAAEFADVAGLTLHDVVIAERALNDSPATSDSSRVAFRHSLYRETVLAQAEPSRLASLHSAAADIALASDGSTLQHQVRTFNHLVSAGRTAEAVALALELAERAIDAGDNRTAYLVVAAATELDLSVNHDLRLQMLLFSAPHLASWAQRPQSLRQLADKEVAYLQAGESSAIPADIAALYAHAAVETACAAKSQFMVAESLGTFELALEWAGEKPSVELRKLILDGKSAIGAHTMDANLLSEACQETWNLGTETGDLALQLLGEVGVITYDQILNPHSSLNLERLKQINSLASELPWLVRSKIAGRSAIAIRNSSACTRKELLWWIDFLGSIEGGNELASQQNWTATATADLFAQMGEYTSALPLLPDRITIGTGINGSYDAVRNRISLDQGNTIPMRQYVRGRGSKLVDLERSFIVALIHLTDEQLDEAVAVAVDSPRQPQMVPEFDVSTVHVIGLVGLEWFVHNGPDPEFAERFNTAITPYAGISPLLETPSAFGSCVYDLLSGKAEPSALLEHAEHVREAGHGWASWWIEAAVLILTHASPDDFDDFLGRASAAGALAVVNKVLRHQSQSKSDSSNRWGLTPREYEVLESLAMNPEWTNADIAKALFIALGTVRVHLKNVFKKLDVASRADAVAAFAESGYAQGG